MREIKFRAWDKINKYWIDTGFLIDSASGEILLLDTGFDNKELKRGQPTEYELMQYTGLKDKNGKEIYEGDILEWSWVNKPTHQERAEIIYHKSGFLLRQSNTWLGHVPVSDTYNIIGNIYENPELLI